MLLLDANVTIEFNELDLVLFDVSYSKVCKNLDPISIDINKIVEPACGEFLYLEGFPATKNKVPLRRGVKPVGFPVKEYGKNAVKKSPSEIATVNGTRGYFRLARDNCVDKKNDDVQFIPHPKGMSGCPIFYIGPTTDVLYGSSIVEPTLIGNLTEYDESDNIGAFAPLVPALKVAIAKIKK